MLTEGHGRQDHARRANTALGAAMLHERVLHRMIEDDGTGLGGSRAAGRFTWAASADVIATFTRDSS